MVKVNAKIITPDENTFYLVGAEGTVWTQPALGDPYILAAQTDADKRAAAQFVGALLQQNQVPYGMPLTQRVNVAMFGGSPLRDCEWVKWSDAPAPSGGDPLPTQAAIIQTDEK